MLFRSRNFRLQLRIRLREPSVALLQSRNQASLAYLESLQATLNDDAAEQVGVRERLRVVRQIARREGRLEGVVDGRLARVRAVLYISFERDAEREETNALM